jgi:hypothetical protein
MPDGKMEAGKSMAESGAETVPVPRRALDWTLRVWRPAGTVVAIGLAGLLMWHVINGKNGLQVWQQKRVEDHQLQEEIKDLQQENAQLRVSSPTPTPSSTRPAKSFTTPSQAR